MESLLVGKGQKLGERGPLIWTKQTFQDQEIPFWIKRDCQSQKPLNSEASYFDAGERGGRFHPRRTAGLQDILVKIFTNLNVLDHFCLFPLLIHSTLKFLHSMTSCLQGEFRKQPGEEISNVPAVYIHCIAFYHWPVTEDLFAKKMLKSWVTFFLTYLHYIFWTSVIMEKGILWERDGEVQRGRDGGVS